MLGDNYAFSSFSVDDIEVATKFYEHELGLKVEVIPEGLQLQLASGGRVFIYPKGPAHTPASFTVLNFPVADVEAVVDELSAKGVVFEQYDEGFMKTDAKGIARNDNPEFGPRAMAWFKDPAGNVLAVLENNEEDS